MKWQTKVRQGVKRNSSGVKHFLKGVKKNLGGLTPPNPPPRKSVHAMAFRQEVSVIWQDDVLQCCLDNVDDAVKEK